MSAQKWPRKRVEKEPTGPADTWISCVIDCDPSQELPIVISEEARDGIDAELYDADRILIDLETAEWLAAQLTEAIAKVKAER